MDEKKRVCFKKRVYFIEKTHVFQRKKTRVFSL